MTSNNPDFPSPIPDKLCSTCSTLNLNAKHFVVLPKDTKAKELSAGTTTLGTVADLRAKSSCPFCRLLISSLGGSELPTVEDGQPVYVMMRWGHTQTIIDSNQSQSEIDQVSVRNIFTHAGTLAGSRRNRHVRPKEGYINPRISVLAEDLPVSSKALLPRLIKEKVDLDMVRTWISMCEEHHGPRCNFSDNFLYESENPAQQIPSFRLVDVVENRIVRAPTDCKYLTLSYVWGRVEVLQTVKANIHLLEQPGSLLSPQFATKIPRTIRDAMEVTKLLNFRYLWVDSLCIIQDDDTGSKAEAIAKMDLVYGACFLTIIATGPHADAGIEGVLSNPRGRKQMFEEISPGFTLVAESSKYNYMKDSVYSTRAWTYQERHFTPRSLTFAGGQASFTCGQASWEESTIESYILPKRDKTSFPVDLGFFSGTVKIFSALSLTFDSDIHNAFAGLARYFQAGLDTNLVFGIPDKYFDWCLLWMPHAEHDRRKGAPSWSWTGWKGQSLKLFGSNMYPREGDKIFNALQNRTWIIWYHRVAHESTKCVRIWEDPTKTPSPDTNGPLNYNFYGGKMEDRFGIDCSRTVPTPKTLKDAPSYYKDITNSGSGFLQFWTVSVMFNLATPTSEAPRISFTSRVPTPRDVRVGVFGRDGYEITALILDKDWYNRPGRADILHEFILLCESRDEGPRNLSTDPDNDRNSWKYSILLIETHESGQWAERVSLGSIAKKDLNQALGEGPTWKEIILG